MTTHKISSHFNDPHKANNLCPVATNTQVPNKQESLPAKTYKQENAVWHKFQLMFKTNVAVYSLTS